MNSANDTHRFARSIEMLIRIILASTFFGINSALLFMLYIGITVNMAQHQKTTIIYSLEARTSFVIIASITMLFGYVMKLHRNVVLFFAALFGIAWILMLHFILSITN